MNRLASASLLGVLLLLSLTILPALAATYHVNIQGHDGNPGTASAPFRTVQRGLSASTWGDVVLLHGGTYAEGDLTPPSGVILRSAPGETAILKPGRVLDSLITYLDGRSHITLDGLVLDGSGPRGDERLVRFPLFTNQGNHHLTLKNSEVRHSFFSCLLISGSEWDISNNHIHHCGLDTTYDHGIYFTGDHSRIVGNRLHDNACFNIQNYGRHDTTHNVYEGNHFTASGCGFVASTGSDIMFRGNIMVGDGRQNPSGAMQMYVPRMAVVDNVFVDVSIVARPLDGLEIARNTICRGTIDAPAAVQRDNRLTCEGLPALDRPPGGSGPAPARLPAPKNLRVRMVP